MTTIEPVKVNCARCGRDLWIEHVGITLCKCGVRHHYNERTQANQ